MYLSKLQTVFLKNTRCICQNYKLYFLKLQGVFVKITNCINRKRCRRHLKKSLNFGFWILILSHNLGTSPWLLLWDQIAVISRLRIGTLIWWRVSQWGGGQTFITTFLLSLNFTPKTFKPQHWNSDKCVNQPFVGKLGPFVCVNQWIHVLAERVALHQISVPIRNLEMTFVWPQTNWDDIYLLSKSKLRWHLFGLKHIEMIFICSESANWDDIYLVSKRKSNVLSRLLFWLREWWDSNTAKFCLSRSKWGNAMQQWCYTVILQMGQYSNAVVQKYCNTAMMKSAENWWVNWSKCFTIWADKSHMHHTQKLQKLLKLRKLPKSCTLFPFYIEHGSISSLNHTQSQLHIKPLLNYLAVPSMPSWN